MQDLGTLGGFLSIGYGINNVGQVIGYSFLTGDLQHHAFLYSGGSMLDLGALGGSQSIGYGINDVGEAVGSFWTSSGQQRAFLYSGGSMINLNDLLPSGSGWILEETRDINNNGQITGRASNGIESHAFLLTPDVSEVPEPASFALLGTGLAGLVGMRWRRRQTELNA